MSNENKKLGQNPAFPSEFTTGAKGEFGEPIISHRISYGMSKRFYAACAAMQGLIASTANELDFPSSKYIAEKSFEFADELLKQESNG